MAIHTLKERIERMIRVPRCAFCTKEQEEHCMGKVTTTYRNPKRKVLKDRPNCRQFCLDEKKVDAYRRSRVPVKSTPRPPWFWLKGEDRRAVMGMFLKDPDLGITKAPDVLETTLEDE